MLVRRWRLGAVVISLAVTGWTAWFTADVLGEWFTTALFLAAPALVAVLLAPAWRSGAAVVGGLLAGLVGLVVASTRWPHALRPPQTDWLLPYLALAVLVWVAAFTACVATAEPERRKTLLLSGAGGAVVLLCLAAVVANGPAGLRPRSSDVAVDRNDLGPFPAVLQSRRIGLDCRTGTGVCTEAIEVWSSTGQPPAEIAELLAQHLRTKDWPMSLAATTGRLTGCLPIRGIIRWADQACAELIPSSDLSWPDDVKHHDDSIVLVLADRPLTALWRAA
ncbi:hypothetical protein ACFFX1_14395 [Dactylosporangium sucinum]|uniref:Uncharacterized protein n=1 Tax=Dactylosporangium sucinum TaxID=1424081 RepID=A0A917X5B5_9ACTN|nr:hypothetical protein [Dactylosporangium sucinum]GGM69839.1 hypothetical protein GCM10007977_084500 [Dactylosporangium sucinum]